MTTVSSGWITIQAVISGEPSAARTTAIPLNGFTPIASPPPRAAPATMNERREILGASIMVAAYALASHLDGLATP
jgi:hypothetical protein